MQNQSKTANIMSTQLKQILPQKIRIKNAKLGVKPPNLRTWCRLESPITAEMKEDKTFTSSILSHFTDSWRVFKIIMYMKCILATFIKCSGQGSRHLGGLEQSPNIV